MFLYHYIIISWLIFKMAFMCKEGVQKREIFNWFSIIQMYMNVETRGHSFVFKF
jgi:hypothetical protein